MSSKRPRTFSPSPSRSSSPTSSPTSKLIKTVQDVSNAPLTCTLPPTCAHPHKPTQLASTRDLEAHYATYHSHVCEHEGCGNVFPDAWLLELHFAECHDPITALKKERGEKTFSCHLAACPRLFLTPKARRLHLIQAHGYPKEYFFSVTNKGIGGLLSKWGQGASLIRGQWRARVRVHDMRDGSDSDIEDLGTLVNGKQKPPHMDLRRDVSDMSNSLADSPPDIDSTLTTSSAHRHSRSEPESDTLADAMSSLSLVPSKIRFGRGGKKGGFVHSHATESTGRQRGHTPTDKSKSEGVGVSIATQARRRGGRRAGRRKASEGTSSTSGDLDVVTMQE